MEKEEDLHQPSSQQFDTQRLLCVFKIELQSPGASVCVYIMMPSPAVVSELQLPRSQTPTEALCGKSLADPGPEETTTETDERKEK